MKTVFYIIVIVSIYLSGCGGNVQKGQYAVMSYSSSSLANDRGALLVVKGVKLNSDGNLSGDEVPLFYLLVVLPEDKFTGHGAKNDNKSYESLFELWWYKHDSPETEAFRLKLNYDRKKDVVNLYDMNFNRTEGNTFMVKFDKNMDYKISRFGTISEDNSEKVMDYIKSQTKADQDMFYIFLYRK